MYLRNRSLVERTVEVHGYCVRPKLNFGSHSNYTIPKAGKYSKNLIEPNVKGRKEKKLRLLAWVM